MDTICDGVGYHLETESYWFGGILGARVLRLKFGLVLALSGTCLLAQRADHKITVTGKLVRAMAIGAESTGWALEFKSPKKIAGQELISIQIHYPDTEQLEKLQNKQVRITGTVVPRQGVETADQLVLEVSSVRIPVASQGAQRSKATSGLSRTEWRLEELGGNKLLDNSEATLYFPESGKIAGNGSCNRFFGTVEVNGKALKLGPLASSRMACPEAIMNQERKYLEALQSAERFDLQGSHLKIYCAGIEKPLRFTRMAGTKAGTP